MHWNSGHLANDSPIGLYARKFIRSAKTCVVSASDSVRVELMLPAPIVQRLASESAEIGCSMSRIMGRWLRDLEVLDCGTEELYEAKRGGQADLISVIGHF